MHKDYLKNLPTKSPNTPVVFIADVRELRMELIFPRSTLARLTPRGAVGALGPVAEVGVTGVAGVAAAVLLVLEAFVGVVGSFDATSDLLVFVTGVKDLSFFSSAHKNNSNYS